MSWEPFLGPAEGSLVRKCALPASRPASQVPALMPTATVPLPTGLENRLFGAAVPLTASSLLPAPPTRPPEAAASPPALTYSEGLITSGAAATANFFRGPAWTAHAQCLPALLPPQVVRRRGAEPPPASELLLRTRLE